MNQTFIRYAVLAAIVIAPVFAVYLSWQTPQAVGSAFPGLQATVATSSALAVGAASQVIFATSTCASRTIGTDASPIMLIFSDFKGETPTGSNGYTQAASTTVTYDGGQFGCGAFKVFSYASQTINVIETR